MRIADLPEDIAQRLNESPDLSRAALEAIAVEGARSGELTTAQVRRLVGFETRFVAEIERDAETSRTFRRQWSWQPMPGP